MTYIIYANCPASNYIYSQQQGISLNICTNLQPNPIPPLPACTATSKTGTHAEKWYSFEDENTLNNTLKKQKERIVKHVAHEKDKKSNPIPHPKSNSPIVLCCVLWGGGTSGHLGEERENSFPYLRWASCLPMGLLGQVPAFELKQVWGDKGDKEGDSILVQVAHARTIPSRLCYAPTLFCPVPPFPCPVLSSPTTTFPLPVDVALLAKL